MKINRTELLNVLNMIKPGVTTKELIEGSSHFIFRDSRVFSFNDQITISSHSPVNLNCTVPSDTFYSLLNKIQEEEICLEVEDDLLKMTNVSESLKVRLNVLKETEASKILSSLSLEDLNSWENLPEDFAEGVSLCMFSVSKDATLGWMTCIWISGSTILSSDDLRITKFEMKEKIPDSFFLPLSSLVALLKFNPTKYCLRSGWAHFKNDEEVIFSSRILDTTEPEEDIESFFAIEGTELLFLNNESFKNAVKRVEVIEDKIQVFDRKVLIKVEEKDVVVQGQREDVGWIEEKIQIETGVKDAHFLFQINPTFFLEAIEKISPLVLILGEGSCLFKSEFFKHIMVLPI